MSAAGFEPARPLPAAGSPAAGDYGQTWWSRRFLELLESFGVGSRLERGRGYASGGQVTELEVEPGIVLARVQGTRYTPYRVRIRPKLLSEHQWRRAERAMAAEALPLAQLLAGTMPPDIEDVLSRCKLTCVGTLEERIDELIASKRELAESIVGSGEAWLTELDTAQLRKLVALSGDAVAA